MKKILLQLEKYFVYIITYSTVLNQPSQNDSLFNYYLNIIDCVCFNKVYFQNKNVESVGINGLVGDLKGI